MKKYLSTDSLRDHLQKFCFLLIMLSGMILWGQSPVSITTPKQTYTQDFNSLSTTGTTFSNGNTLQGWYISSATLLVGDGSGASPSNSCYNYGSSNNTDRSIGALSSSSNTHRFGVRFKNNTGAAITSVTISYTGEQWRQNTAAQNLIFDYRISSTAFNNYLNDGTFTVRPDLDFVSPQLGTAGPVDGNSAIYRTAKSETFSVNIPAGSELFIRWTKSGSNSHGLSVDDVNVNFGAAAVITTGTIAGSPFCVTSASGSSLFDVPFTSTGTFSGNTYTAQLSNATGNFASASTIGTLVSNANSGSISASVPANTVTGSGYRIRVIASNPSTIGTVNGTNLTVNLAKNGIAPAESQSIPEGVNGTVLSVTEQSTPNSRVWKYATSSGGIYSAFMSSQTGTSYTPNFVAAGTYYVVCESTFACGTERSNEVIINVAKPSVTITGVTGLFTYAQGQGPSASQSVTVSGSNLASDITLNVPSAYWEMSTNAQFLTPASTITLAKNASNSVASTTVYIRLKAGLVQGQYNFATDDDLQATSSSAVTKTLDLDGEVTEPKAELNVRGVFDNNTPTNSIPNGDTTPMTLDNTEFASQNIGASQTKTFRLESVGGSVLNVNSLSLDNTNDFTITASAPYNIASGSFQDFTITFHPAAAGDRTAKVSIASSDLTDPTYTFTILGLGKNPEIAVSGNGNNIPNGSTTTSASNNTLIGNANVNTANPTTVAKTFVISNSGNVALIISGITISGTDASQFSVSPTSASVAAGTTGTVTITFAPTSEGVKNATVNITNNDATGNSNPYTFAIKGNSVSFIKCAAGALGSSEIIGIQDFETPSATPTWSYTNTGGTVTGGTATATVSGANATVNKFIGANSYQVSGGAGILNFNFDTSSYQDVELSFRLGSFSGSPGNGADAGDNVKIAISTDGVNFVDELLVKGNAANMRWSFGATGSASSVYNSILDEFASSTGDSGISTVTLTNLPHVANLHIRMTASNNDANEIWAIDNVTLKGKLPAGVSQKTWDGFVWSGDGLPPTASQKAIINGDLTLPYTVGSTTYSSLEACECQVNAGKTLNIGTSLPAQAVIQGRIMNAGFVNLASDSNLQQIDPFAENTFAEGSFTAKRFAKLPKMGYTYWSSPVNNQNLYAFSDGGTADGTPKNRFWQYDEATDRFKNTGIFLLNDSSVFETGKGYAIRGQNQFDEDMPSVSHEFAFTGTPNNGNLSFSNLKNSGADYGYNLVGNPYPSNIDFDELYHINSTKIYATAYFWTNNDMTVTTQQGSGYSGNNYAIYNLTGGVPAVEIDAAPDQPEEADNAPNNIVKVGQGFIIKAKNGANNQTLDFTNAVRVTENGMFFNNKKTATKNRFWLKLTSPAKITNTTLIGYIPAASNDFEIDFDGELFVVGSDAFYSQLGSRKLAIQGKSTFDASDKVNLGNVYSQNGIYTISLKNKEGIFDGNQDIYLKDKLLNKIINLSNGDYTFHAVKGTDQTRFEIVYKDDAVLGAATTLKSNFTVYRDGTDYIISSSKILGKVEVYDASGRLVVSQKTTDTNMRLDFSVLGNGVYIIKAENSGEIKTKKVIR